MAGAISSHSSLPATFVSLAALPAAFASLGSALRRSDTLQGTIWLSNDPAARDAVRQPVPIPTQAPLFMPAAFVDGAVANAPGQRLAQPLPLVVPRTINTLPPTARPKCDLDDRYLLLKSANRPQFNKTSGVRIPAFRENAEYVLQMRGRPLDRLASFIISCLGATEAVKVRRSHFCCLRRRQHCVQKWSHHSLWTTRVRRLVPSTAAWTGSVRFRIYRFLRRTHDGPDDAGLSQIPNLASARHYNRELNCRIARHVDSRLSKTWARTLQHHMAGSGLNGASVRATTRCGPVFFLRRHREWHVKRDFHKLSTKLHDVEQ